MNNANKNDDIVLLEQLLTKQTQNIDMLTQNISHLTQILDQITQSLTKIPTKRDNARWLIVTNVIVVAALFVSSLFLWHTSSENHKLIAKVNDCVDQKGECYKKGGARTAKAITLIINGVQCKVELAIAKGFESAKLPTYQLDPECKQALTAAK